MKRAKPLDLFLGTLAIGTAVAVLFRRKRPEPAAAGAPQPRVPLSGKEWAGSLARTIRREVREDETVMIAAALSFYTMLAIVPTVAAAVLIYALVLDPADVAAQITTVTDVLPPSVSTIVSREIETLARTSDARTILGLVVSLTGTLWVASGGVRALLHGINIVYNVDERRRWLVQRALASALTVGGIVFGLTTIAVVTFLPGWLEDLGLGSTGVLLVEVARWPAIFGIVVGGLTALYRVGPNLPGRRKRVLLPGALTAAALWLLATLGFSIYAGSGLSSFESGTFGTLTSFIVVLVWLFISGFVVLLGAEINATLEANPRRPGSPA